MALHLVTGGAGFIGSNIVRALLERGDRVRVVDDFSTGRRSNVEELLSRPGFDLLEGDLADAEVARRAVDGVEVVFHQAAIPSVPRSVANPVECDRAIVHATVTLLQACRHSGARRLVFAGSSSVYGESPVLPKEESMPPDPISPYAVAKLAGEQYARVFNNAIGFETITLRYFNVFGPRQDPGSEYAAVIPKFITLLLAGKAPTIFGDGSQTRDFCFVRNVVAANLLAADVKGAGGRSFNIATGTRITLLQLVQTINELLGTDIEPILGEARTGDIKHSLASIERAREVLGYEPKYDLRAGLRETIEWFRAV